MAQHQLLGDHLHGLSFLDGCMSSTGHIFFNILKLKNIIAWEMLPGSHHNRVNYSLCSVLSNYKGSCAKNDDFRKPLLENSPPAMLLIIF